MGILDLFGKKPRNDGDSGSSGPQTEYATRHCFVLCRSESPGDLSRANAVVAKIFGPGFSAESKNSIITVAKGAESVGFIAHMPAPIPDGEAESNADGNFLWPHGKDEVAQHRSHVVVTNMGGQEQTPIQSAVTVTQLALVALDVFGGIGVYWGNASVCNSRQVFEELCENISAKHLPVPAWLRFQVMRVSENELGIYTLGMKQFGLMEIEVDRCQMELEQLFEFVSNLAHYLIQSGPVIADGNTVGGSEEERIVVFHQPSIIDPQRQVYKIVFDNS